MDTSLHLELYAQHKKMAEDIRAMRDHMARIRATAESDDGLITATVGAAHELIELQLDPRIYRTPDSTALAKAIVATVHRAMELAQEEGFAIVRRYLPEEATSESADLRFDPLLNKLDEETARGEQR
ncbi:YbaB/EbfC family nucleoid-associated protein [Dactylosporangium sp. AC04546]|uniref:YbaB/EbfC family nucleoid-associated protein n=1 Tax=Dactylosporangium sp. AC04546 TaxID=2862460 RepID=UPI001EDCFE0D|nr:YbaB/EbfC family nucleoid-associated protein [Dactylosporangium sp. AC04546]WVK87338.1 YbaB/EbfC family nucleoid-associated protein [Dactylosporangium sp. AC04546]